MCSHTGELDLLLLHRVSFSNSVLVEVSLEDACENAAKSSSSNVCTLVDQGGLRGTGVDPLIHDSLEDWLNGADGWVDASAGNTFRGLDARVESDTNGDSVEWNVLGTIMLHNLDNKSDKEESHHELNKESLWHELATIIAAICWAKLMQVVVALWWNLGFFRWGKWEAHKTYGTSEHCTEHLSKDD